MLVLGAVREIHQCELVVSLPYNLRGSVGIGDISDVLVGLLQKEGCPDLHRLYYVGQLLTCYVLETDLARKIVKLTINPSIINNNVANIFVDMVSCRVKQKDTESNLPLNNCLESGIHQCQRHRSITSTIVWGALNLLSGQLCNLLLVLHTTVKVVTQFSV